MGQDPRNGLQSVRGSWGGPFDKGSHTPFYYSYCCWWTTTGVVLVVLLLLLSLRITMGEGGGDPSSAATAHPDATATLKAEQQLLHCVLCISMLYGALCCSYITTVVHFALFMFRAPKCCITAHSHIVHQPCSVQISKGITNITFI